MILQLDAPFRSSLPKNEGGDVVNNATILWLGIMAVIGIVMIVMKKRSNAKDEG